MPVFLLADLILTLGTFRMVLAPAMAGCVLTAFYINNTTTPSAEVATLLMGAGLAFGLYKLLWVPDPRQQAEDEANTHTKQN